MAMKSCQLPEIATLHFVAFTGMACRKLESNSRDYPQGSSYGFGICVGKC
jgi:hypothetical protein